MFVAFTEAGDNISAFSILLICPPKINSGGRSDTKDPVQGTVIGGFLMPAVNKDKAVTSQSLDQGSVTTVGLQQRRDPAFPLSTASSPSSSKAFYRGEDYPGVMGQDPGMVAILGSEEHALRVSGHPLQPCWGKPHWSTTLTPQMGHQAPGPPELEA